MAPALALDTRREELAFVTSGLMCPTAGGDTGARSSLLGGLQEPMGEVPTAPLPGTNTLCAERGVTRRVGATGAVQQGLGLQGPRGFNMK